MKLERRDVLWLTKHNLDAMGETFKYKERIFRLIKPDKTDYVKELFNKGIIDELYTKEFMVKTWICDEIQIAGMEESLILEHEAIKDISYSYEWTYNMFLETSKMIAELNVFLLERGYEIVDCHQGNIAFRGCKPLYLDMGSIVPARRNGLESWTVFRKYWINPMMLINIKDVGDKVFRALIYNGGALSTEEFYRLTRNFSSIYVFLTKIINAGEYRLFDNRIESNRKVIKLLANSIRHILRLDEEKTYTRLINKYKTFLKKSGNRYAIKENGVWTDYSNDYLEEGKIVVDDRFQYYINLIKELRKKEKISTVFEIAGNSGAMSQLLLENDAIDMACVSDYDLGAVEKGFMRCKDNSVLNERISFVVMDVIGLLQNIQELSWDRFKSDIVIAMAVTHHLLLTQGVKLSTIVDILAKYTQKYLIIEFMPLGLWSGDDSNCPPIPSYYNLEWFLNGLKEKFVIINVEQLSKNRVAVLCQLDKNKSC